MKPVIAKTLRYLTNQFPSRMKLQYLGQDQTGQFLFSDSVHVIPVTLGLSYRSMFANNTVTPLTVITVLCSSRKRVRPFNVTFINIKIESQYSVDVQLGNPVPY